MDQVALAGPNLPSFTRAGQSRIVFHWPEYGDRMRGALLGLAEFLSRRSRLVAASISVGLITVFSLLATYIIYRIILGRVEIDLLLAACVTTLCVAVPLVIMAQKLVRDLRESRSMLKALVGEVVAARDDAVLANRFKSQFLANLSHELRTPLNSIIGFSQVLQKQAHGPLGDARYLGYSNDIQLSGQHLLDLITDILQLAKIESGAIALDEGHETDLDEVIGECVHILQPLADQRGVSLGFSGRPAEAVMKINERMLRQIILNIVSNALKFTEADGFVRLYAEPRPDGGLDLLIHDTGIGISDADMPVALMPFGQIANQASTEQGSGLGLPLVKAMMEQQGGMLLIDSVPGDGTIVVLTFPSSRVERRLQLRRANGH